MQKSFYLTTRIDVVHIGVNNNLEHHAGMVSATTYSMIEFMKLAQVKLVYYCRDDPYWVISRYIFIYSLWKKDDSVGIVRTIMYLCHIIKFSMSKGTKSFGHDKALACESRGFVCKKRGCAVLTHPLFVIRFQLCYYKTKSNHRLNYMKNGCFSTRQSDCISLIFLFLSSTLKAVGLLKYGSLPQRAVSGTRTDCSAG